MRSLSAPWRKALLTLHVASSVGWAGAVAAFAAVAALGWAGADAASAPGIAVALRLMIWAVIVPAALLALVSGTLQSLATPWGLVRHWWIVAKLVLTVPATAILLLHTVWPTPSRRHRAPRRLRGCGSSCWSTPPAASRCSY